jgi:hypothetical protein
MESIELTNKEKKSLNFYSVFNEDLMSTSNQHIFIVINALVCKLESPNKKKLLMHFLMLSSCILGSLSKLPSKTLEVKNVKNCGYL